MEFGVDEAGKGPVLGSMFAAAVVADPTDLPADVGDSKGIRPDRREELAAAVRDLADAVGVAEVTVDRIDAEGTDMNSLTVAVHGEALDEALAKLDGPGPGGPGTTGLDGVSGYVDAGDTNAVRFERRVADTVTASADLDVRAEHGADEAYPVVGAASIVAKVARDAHVDRLADEYGALGSGYPGDPATREFLETYVADHGGLPSCARRSWQTCDDVLAAADQSSLAQFGPEPDGGWVIGSGATTDSGDVSQGRTPTTDGGPTNGGDPRPTTLDEF